MNVHLTLDEVKDTIKRELSDSSPKTEALIDHYIRSFNRMIEKDVNFDWLWKTDVYSFDVVQGQNEYVLPFDFKDIIVEEGLTYDGSFIPIVPEDEFFYNHANEINLSGTPSEARLANDIFVANQINTAGTISVVSTSASDTTQTLLAIGTVGGVEDTREEITLSGTSTKAGTLNFQKLFSLTLDSDPVGTITISSGATTLLTLPPGVRSRKFSRLILWKTPDSTADGTECLVKYKRRIPDAINDSEPIYFDDIDLYLSYVIKRISAKVGDVNSYTIYDKMYQEQLSYLRRERNKQDRDRKYHQIQPGSRRAPDMRPRTR